MATFRDASLSIYIIPGHSHIFFKKSFICLIPLTKARKVPRRREREKDGRKVTFHPDDSADRTCLFGACFRVKNNIEDRADSGASATRISTKRFVGISRFGMGLVSRRSSQRPRIEDVSRNSCRNAGPRNTMFFAWKRKIARSVLLRNVRYFIPCIFRQYDLAFLST